MIRATVAVLAAAVVVACSSGGTSATPSPKSPRLAPQIGWVTVTATGCSYEGLHHPVVGGKVAALRLNDQRQSGFNVHLFLLDKDYAFADWTAGFLVSHATLVEHARRVADGQAKAGTDAIMPVTFASSGGTYGILCVPLQNGDEYGVGYTTGPIVVPAAGAAATPVAQGAGPSPRGYAALGDIPGSGFLMFGGFVSPNIKKPPDFINEMWAYDPHSSNNRWRQLSTESNPKASDGGLICLATCARLFYDDGTTWIFDVASGRWQQRRAGHTLHGMRAAYDSESNRVIEFGGDNFDELPVDETWAYDPTADTWTQLHPKQNPPARYWFGMAYD